jgi:U3 small nucleolar RNA-associated protein 22
MAPATKRRKLSHDGTSEGSPAEDKSENYDESMDLSEPAPISKKPHTPRPHRRPDTQLQDGVYTVESFKNNVFKLQIDQLLEQVKPKYGKKEAPAEHVMRILRNLIEQLPNRAPLSVCGVVLKFVTEY